VRSGETLSAIARKYGVRVSDIQKWNGLRGTTIQIGQRLIVKK
jgi:membrane-bound lytic murein transglycosylase D